MRPIMGRDKLNVNDHPPASVFPLQEPAKPAVSVSTNGAADYGRMLFAPNAFAPDLFSFSHGSLPIAHPLQKMNMAQSYEQLPKADDKLTASFLTRNNMQNPHADPYPNRARSNVITHLRVPEVTTCKGEPVETYQSMNPLKAQSVFSFGLPKPALCTNSMQPGSNTDEFNQMDRQGWEAESNSVSRLDINGNSSNIGHSTSSMHHAVDIARKDSSYGVNFCFGQHGFAEQFDRNFLTLGTGSNKEASSKRQFSTRGIANKLGEAAYPQSKHAYTPLNNVPNLQSNSHRPSSLACNAGGLIFSCNNGVLHSASTGLSSGQPYGVQMLEADTQHNFNVNSYGNSDFVNNTSVRYSDICPVRGIAGDQVPVPLPFDRSSTYASHSGSIELSGWASRSATPAWITPQPMPNHQQYSQAKNDVKTLTGSSICGSLPRLGGSHIGQYHTGTVIPPSEGSAIPAFHNSSYTTESQPTDHAGKVHHTRSFPWSQFQRNLAFSPGKIQGGMPVPNAQNLPVAGYTAGPVIHTPKVVVSQASSTARHPSVKRGAIAPPSTTPSSQRRKLIPQPISYHSTSYLSQSVPAPSPIPAPSVVTIPAPTRASSSIQVPPPSVYIRSQGSEEPSQPLGHKCLICKRDLSFAPEGTFHQPAIPPPVAILPCGHTFHDHCLQLIVPEDQSKDPPCIPCALGET